MDKRYLLLALVVFAFAMFLSAGLYAAQKECPDVVQMKNDKAFEKHKMGIVEFSHKKHAEEYKAGCGDCHHDDKGEPLTALKCTDEVKSCFECHNKTGVPKMDKSIPAAERKKQEVTFYYGAIHANCIDCHKKVKQEKKSEKAPVGCIQCHPKVAKK